MKLAIGGDHAGFEYKKQLVEFLKKEGHEVKDFGPDTDASVDYPDHVHPLSEAVEKGEFELGILICGSANGVAMTANKHQGIRAGIAWEDELAALTRQHNNANVICIPARFIDYDKTLSIVKTFLATEFEGGRHERRVDKIGC
ncbi:ribose 5-phosphate isomerase B [Marivirga tractuosa]|uniref:Sugar-phosphate isomerase, RpiB/LacA/LacB family n=1 Tax=Marivirga tractuosa (strain ATCC 23168 / DSM 4126 / NBRC 15989 / NCIMB 1408 / VKM B-1430 / H-43) TaxID=643867 RepID=E4TPN1_MARTH|nr:ribose 5-phosphate isomerase B [Marivirga tractuosa]ADR22595.1 sugar-phosphate isomerase, RpiB/LacA/LacB family [Marivirga tractuosa DSM 4126]BDD16734.1 ribose 5-phosphate isomerase B [Marivirga tractuosa]